MPVFDDTPDLYFLAPCRHVGPLVGVADGGATGAGIEDGAGAVLGIEDAVPKGAALYAPTTNLCTAAT